MAETSVAALDPRLQKQVESARIAYGRGNFDYTIALCRSVLKERPSCLSVRKLHRTAVLRLHQGSGAPFVVTFGTLANVPLILKPDVRPDREPLAAVENAEKMIENDPHSTDALRLLGEAAVALGWKETAVFAYESIRDEAPRDADNLVALGEAQLAAGRSEDAVITAERVLKIDPANERARGLLRGASVAQAVRVGRWEENGDVRSRMRN